MSSAKFWFENQAGDKLSLNGDAGYLFKNVEGLGIDYSSTFHSMINGFYSRTYTDIKQSSLVGDLVYMGDANAKYKAFIDWILSATAINLIYQPEAVEYRRKIVIGSVEKANRHPSGWMQGELELKCLTPWYTTETKHIEGSGTVYASCNVTALGQLPSAVVAKIISGGVSYSKMTIGELGGFQINRETSEGDTIVYSSQPDDSYISVNGEDYLKYLDELANIYPVIPAGETVTIKVYASSATSSESADITVYHYWRAV